MFIHLLIAFIPPFIILATLFLLRKKIVHHLFTTVAKTLLTDHYEDNLFEMVPAARRSGLITIMENQLRSQYGTLLYRSMGTSKDWPNFEAISFTPVQTTPFPIDHQEKVDLSRTIGPQAKIPLEINIPIMIGGMAYGLALSKEAKVALAQASAIHKTAINSGEGPVLKEEFEAAHKYILQFSKTKWGKEEKWLSKADMIEIKLGQGAIAGMGSHIDADRIPEEVKKLLGLSQDEPAVIHEHFFKNQTLEDLKALVQALRETSGGVPIGVKLLASGQLEEDLDRILEMSVDVIALEGAQGGTHGSPPILQDDFGIPTLHALVRANRHLQKRQVKDKISLIISGGLNVPGDFLKALALGADAIYIGTAMLYAINHTQFLHALPWEPPSQTLWITGTKRDSFDVEEGTKYGAHFLQACVEEMQIALQAMGKKSLAELSADDLITYDETIAKMAQITYSFATPKEDQSHSKT